MARGAATLALVAARAPSLWGLLAEKAACWGCMRGEGGRQLGALVTRVPLLSAVPQFPSARCPRWLGCGLWVGAHPSCKGGAPMGSGAGPPPPSLGTESSEHAG